MSSIHKFLFAFTVVATLSIHAGDWPHWRGPNFDGSTTEKNLPETWSLTENVKWKAALPGYSGSTPIVWGDSIFLSSPDSAKNLTLICLNRKDGSTRWQKVVGVGDRASGPRANMTSPSPVTDGKRVVVVYGTGDLAAFDFEGKELWKRNIAEEFGRFAIMFLYGSSPLLYENRLYLQVLQTSPVPKNYTHVGDADAIRESFLLCIDPKNGKNIWRHVRNSAAEDESKEAYSSPVPFKGPNGKEILIIGGDVVTGHSAKEGSELWRANILNPKKDHTWRIVPSLVTGKGLIFASAPKRDPVFAIKGGGKGDITETHVAWKLSENPTDWSTPLLYKDRLFVMDGDRHVLTCLKPKTGEKVWSGKIEVREPIWSSPTGADGKIYLISEAGTAFVLDAGDEFKLISTIPMGDAPARSSIVAAHGELLIRTAGHLYCIKK